jgi:hypothetical protein
MSAVPAARERYTESSAAPDSKVHWTVRLESGQTVVVVLPQ